VTDPEAASRLRMVVTRLASEIGPRNVDHYRALCSAADYLESAFSKLGYHPTRQSYEAEGKRFANLIAERKGNTASEEVLVVGAHYDSHKDSPGANDNGSAVAAVLELALLAQTYHYSRTVRFVLFTNEESPFTRTQNMGSMVYARACRENGDKIAGMLCLETLGCYSEEIGSQWLSFGGLLFPRRGNFIAIVGDRASRPLMKHVTASLRGDTSFRFRPLTLPQSLPGARSSDHWSFWKNKYPALMFTDTAPFRYRHYHSRADTPDKLDYDWLALVVDRLGVALSDLAGNIRRTPPKN
jgi:Zn-dependent M28 family amino/carboxypeptidase